MDRAQVTANARVAPYIGPSAARMQISTENIRNSSTGDLMRIQSSWLLRCLANHFLATNHQTMICMLDHLCLPMCRRTGSRDRRPIARFHETMKGNVGGFACEILLFIYVLTIRHPAFMCNKYPCHHHRRAKDCKSTETTMTENTAVAGRQEAEWTVPHTHDHRRAHNEHGEAQVTQT